jgi:hypothetical protein
MLPPSLILVFSLCATGVLIAAESGEGNLMGARILRMFAIGLLIIIALLGPAGSSLAGFLLTDSRSLGQVVAELHWLGWLLAGWLIWILIAGEAVLSSLVLAIVVSLAALSLLIAHGKVLTEALVLYKVVNYMPPTLALGANLLWSCFFGAMVGVLLHGRSSPFFESVIFQALFLAILARDNPGLIAVFMLGIGVVPVWLSGRRPLFFTGFPFLSRWVVLSVAIVFPVAILIPTVSMVDDTICGSKILHTIAYCGQTP